MATPNDFGFQGERPTHPELLDWMAGELIRSGWRLKHIRKLIMTSSVYMQRSNDNEASAQRDVNNRLLWRNSPRRLEAEVIRDSILSVSGQLDRTPFGPGTLDQAMRRRSIYFMIKRSQLIPFLQVFDTAEPLASVGQRPSTTIAPQALYFMNNPRVRGYAASFAQRISTGETDKPIAALLGDLAQRGLLDSTLVVWGGEFGRLPVAQKSAKPGRDHNPHAMTYWFAGGGAKGGTTVATFA